MPLGLLKQGGKWPEQVVMSSNYHSGHGGGPLTTA